MTKPQEYFEELKWAIYDWIGSISVSELSKNKSLALGIEKLCRQLNALGARSGAPCGAV